MATSDTLKTALFGKTTGITEHKDVKSFDADKAADAKAKGLTWLKAHLDLSLCDKCKTVDDYAKMFESCGNGMDLYKKVYTLTDGTIVVEK